MDYEARELGYSGAIAIRFGGETDSVPGGPRSVDHSVCRSLEKDIGLAANVIEEPACRPALRGRDSPFLSAERGELKS